jgi:hypothetical protein
MKFISLKASSCVGDVTKGSCSLDSSKSFMLLDETESNLVQRFFLKAFLFSVQMKLLHWSSSGVLILLWSVEKEELHFC